MGRWILWPFLFPFLSSATCLLVCCPLSGFICQGRYLDRVLLPPFAGVPALVRTARDFWLRSGVYHLSLDCLLVLSILVLILIRFSFVRGLVIRFWSSLILT